MRNLILILAVVSLTVFSVQADTLAEVLEFATEAEGRKLLSAEDDYTDMWTTFDIQSRLGKKDGTKAELLDFESKQVLPWTDSDKKRILSLLNGLDASIRDAGLSLPLPDRILLIKSTLLEEGGAIGYTRENYIVLRQDVIFMEDEELISLILHEVFHILTRMDKGFRSAMYDLIGFTVDNPVIYPEPFASTMITNPDAHGNDSYIRLANADGDEIEVIMVLYAGKPYEGGTFFQYLTIGFAEIIGGTGEKQVRILNKQPVIHSLEDLSGFFDQVGMNTQYIIDPEEIMADNFAHAVMGKTGMPNMDIIEGILDHLRE